MLQPTWLVDGLAGVMVAVSIYCVARLVAARRWGRTLHRDVNVAHVAMGVGMAGMLDASLRTLPTGAWEVVFGAIALWFAAGTARLLAGPGLGPVGGDTAHHISHNLTHLVMAGAMIFMFAEGGAASAGTAVMAMGGGGHGGSNSGLLALLFVFILFVSAIWHADGLSRYTTARRSLVTVAAGAGPSPVPISTGIAPTGMVQTDMVQTDMVPTDMAPTVGGWPSSSAAGSSPEPVAPPEGAGADLDQSRWLAPRLEMGCHIAMCITMGYMLILLL
jgi:hypothetical protein